MNRFLPNKIIAYHLYIFQLEEYENLRFIKSIYKKGVFPPKSLRKEAKWTAKAKVLVLLATIIQLGFSAAISYLLTFYLAGNLPLFLTIGIVTYLVLLVVFPIFLTQVQDILKPLESYKKNQIIKKAKQHLREIKLKNPNLRVIGITGSYGKTTMKEVLKDVLGIKFKVVSTYGNENTPLGISRKILNDLDEKSDLFIVEMGEYVKGDVEMICKITPPDISIITGINEAHLERYGTMQNAIDTKFEIVQNSSQDALILLNADDELSVKNYKRFTSERNLEWFSSKSSSLSNYFVEESELDTKNLGLNFTLKDKDLNKTIALKTKFLAEYVIGNVVAALIIGKKLGMNENEIKLGISKIKPVEHRLEPIQFDSDIVMIDDTYNGNSDGIKEGLELLKKFKNRRKVYITPGLVETGDLAEPIHIEIGKQLSGSADLVVLIKNSVTGYIEKGLLDSGFKSEDIIWFENGKEAYGSLRTFVKSGDVILMQNDWSDNYY